MMLAEPVPYEPTNRTARRHEHARRFVGVDGEGISTPTGRTVERERWVKNEQGILEPVMETAPVMRHDYVLLSVGDQSYHLNGAPLTLDGILDFLWDCFLEDPEAIYGGFYLGYDFTMWLRDLPEPMAVALLSPEGVKRRARKLGKNPRPIAVEYGDWRFDLHAGKRFRLQRNGDKRWMYINDGGSFFQSSFLAAIDPAKWPEPICSDAEYATIVEGKAGRGDDGFSLDMVRYNITENIVWARMMEKLNEGFASMGILLNRDQWYGPGQAAQKWLSLIKAPERRDIEEWVPKRVLQLGLESYYGGWFEITAHGIIPGTTFEYDRNSAYPYEIARLPCLRCGKWELRDSTECETTGNILCLVVATVRQRDSDARLGSMPHRTRDGIILRPRDTRGVYWLRELIAARDAGCIDSIEIHEAWQYVKQCDHEPFAAIKKLYQWRIDAGKNTPLGLALKLVYNSAYGKLAQSVGDPRYANPLYASLITSGCRTEIWQAIATHPERSNAVTMVATDGVFFTSPHPGLAISNRLGDWSVTQKSNLCQMMPGLYWDDAARNGGGGRIKSRGISARDLATVIEVLDMKWEGHTERIGTGLVHERMRRTTRLFRATGNTRKLAQAQSRYLQSNWPSVFVPVSFGMVSAKLAMHRNKWSDAGSIDPKSRFISGSPLWKRDPDTRYVEDGICWTLPYRQAERLESVPYEKRFGLQMRDEILEADVLTPDGTVDDELYDWTQIEEEL
jgi:hypothetical protein